MKPVRFMAAAAGAILLWSCNGEPVESDNDLFPAVTTRQITLRQNAGYDVSVLAFRAEEGRFLYYTLFKDGWSAEGKMTVRLPNGEYRFLFWHGAGDNLHMTPETLLKGETEWDDVAFILREDASAPGNCMPADELYLQYPADEAGKTYALKGSPLSVQAHLQRAVSQIGLTLKRGYLDGGRYVELPYEDAHSILEDAGAITLEIGPTGRSVTSGGSAGTAHTVYRIGQDSQKEITPQGFAKFEGPFLIPPADGAPIPITISVEPTEGSTMPPASIELQGIVERNKRLEITLWFTTAYPVIGIDMEMIPIKDSVEGDSGIWE